MQLRYDSEADVIFLALRTADGGEAGGERLDETRIAHLDRAGNVFAYEFLAVAGASHLRESTRATRR